MNAVRMKMETNRDHMCVSMDQGHFDLNSPPKGDLFDQHLKICNRLPKNNKLSDEVTYEYSVLSQGHTYLWVGALVNPQDPPEKAIFLTHQYIDGHKVGQQDFNLKQIKELTTKGKHSQALQNLRRFEPSNALGQDSKTSRPLTKKKKDVSSISFQPGSKSGYVINPETNREIEIDGPTYKELCKTGKYKC